MSLLICPIRKFGIPSKPRQHNINGVQCTIWSAAKELYSAVRNICTSMLYPAPLEGSNMPTCEVRFSDKSNFGQIPSPTTSVTYNIGLID